MINQDQIKGYLQHTLPAFSNEWTTEKVKNPYVAMQTLLTITAKKIREHKFQEVKKCFDAVSRLYDQGNGVVKNAVENIYVYSLSNLFYASKEEKPKLLAIIPITLYTIYINQLKSGGC